MRWKLSGLKQRKLKTRSDFHANVIALEGFQHVESLSTQTVDNLLIIVLMEHESNILTSDFCQMLIF
jgi:hypothetical protein